MTQAPHALNGPQLHSAERQATLTSVGGEPCPKPAGYVYFIQAGTQGPIKIGWAVDPDHRLGLLQIGNHEELRLLATVEGERALERQIHLELNAHSKRGEWFHDHPDVRAAIDRLNARPDAHHIQTHAGAGNGIQCLNCGTYLTNADGRGDHTHCRACREFAELRDAGIDPFE